MATNKVKLQVETPLSILSSGGTAAITINDSNVGNGAGRLSGRLDLGAYPRPKVWRWSGETAANATATLNKAMDLYIAGWDDESGGSPARPWGGVGASDASFPTEALLANLMPLGSLIVDVVTAGSIYRGGGFFIPPTRHISLVTWNRMGAAAHATATLHKFYFTPVMDDIQAAA